MKAFWTPKFRVGDSVTVTLFDIDEDKDNATFIADGKIVCIDLDDRSYGVCFECHHPSFHDLSSAVKSGLMTFRVKPNTGYWIWDEGSMVRGRELC